MSEKICRCGHGESSHHRSKGCGCGECFKKISDERFNYQLCRCREFEEANATPVEGKEWCEHIQLNKFGDWYMLNDLYLPVSLNQFQFCPICAAPRPAKEETLEEKFGKYDKEFITSEATCGWSAPHREKNGILVGSAKYLSDLVEIARKHYEKQ